jgi:hypothetical protein
MQHVRYFGISQERNLRAHRDVEKPNTSADQNPSVDAAAAAAAHSALTGRRRIPCGAFEVALLVENSPGDAGQLVGERDRQYVAMQSLLGGLDPGFETVPRSSTCSAARPNRSPRPDARAPLTMQFSFVARESCRCQSRLSQFRHDGACHRPTVPTNPSITIPRRDRPRSRADWMRPPATFRPAR